MKTISEEKKFLKKNNVIKTSNSLTIERKGKFYTMESATAEDIMKRRNNVYKFLV